MPWISANMGDVLGSATAKATAAIADAEKSLSALTAQTNALKGKLNSAVNALTGNKTMLDKMAESGLYMITLDPQKGSWAQRLASAANEPPNSGYCTGTANLIIAADPAAVLDAYNKMKDALMKPIDDAAEFISTADVSDFVPELPELPDIPLVQVPDWDLKFQFNEWKACTAGDIFGGAMSGISSASQAINKQAKGAISQLNQVGKLTSGLTKGLDKAKGFINDLAATGAYTIMLPPGQGGYLSRLQSEAGAPPTDPDMYCAGFVCIAMAGGITDLMGKYSTINKLMKG